MAEIPTGAASTNLHCIFNLIDKLVELYERLLASEHKKNDLLKNFNRSKEIIYRFLSIGSLSQNILSPGYLIE